MKHCFFIPQKWMANVRTLVGGLMLFIFMFPGLVEALQTALIRTSDGGVYQIRFRNKAPRRGGYDLGDFVQDFSIYDQSGSVKLCPGNDDDITWELYTAARVLAKTIRKTSVYSKTDLIEAFKQSAENLGYNISTYVAVSTLINTISESTGLQKLSVGSLLSSGAPATLKAVSIITSLANIEFKLRKVYLAFSMADRYANTAIRLQNLANQHAPRLWYAINAGEIFEVTGSSFTIDSVELLDDIKLLDPLRLRLIAEVYVSLAEKAIEEGIVLSENPDASDVLLGFLGISSIIEFIPTAIETYFTGKDLEHLDNSISTRMKNTINRNIQQIYDDAKYDLKWNGYCLPRLKFTAAYLDVYEGASLTYTVSLNSPPDSTATITISSNNSDATVSPNVLTFTPSDWYKPKVVTLRAATDTDNINDRVYLSHTSTGYGDGRISQIPFTIVDRKGNNFPISVDTILPLNLGLGDEFRLDLAKYFRDPENAKLVYWANTEDFNVVTASPDKSGSWITIKPWKIGSTRVTAGATDPGGLRVSQTFTVTVAAAGVNAAPITINTISDQTLIIGNSLPPLNVSNYFRDPDGDLLTYAAWSKPMGIVKVIREGDQITIVPISAGSTTVIVRATDTEGLQVFQRITVTVTTLQIQEPPTSDPVSKFYDLAIQSVSSNKENLSPGESFVLYITVRNNGPDISDTSDIFYYHSSVQGHSVTDPPQLQGSVPLDPIEPGKRETKTIRLQAPSIPKTYYYGAWLAFKTDDIDMNNNVGTEVGVTVMDPTVRTPNSPNPDIPIVEIETTEAPPPPEIETTEAPTTPDIPITEAPTTPDIPTTEVPTSPEIETTEAPPPPDIPTTEAPPPPDIPTTEAPPPPEIETTEAPSPPDIPTTEAPPPPDIPTTEAPPPPEIETTEAPPPPEIETTEAPPPPDIETVTIPGINFGFGGGNTRTENVCDRTQQVLDAILAAMDVDDCANVASKDMDSITTLMLNDTGITVLQEKDFEGLRGLENLDLHSNSLSSLSVGLFDDLRALKTLDMKENSLRSLPDDVFDELRSLKQLDLKDNDLIDLPVGVFDRLNALESLNLTENQLTTLPKGIFDKVMDTLKSDSLSLDDSLKTTYGFSTTTQNAAEGETVRVTVTLGHSLPVAILVPYTIGGTATTADYRNLRPRDALLFRAGETSKEIVFTLREDSDSGVETILLTLGELSDVKIRKSNGTRPNAKLSAHTFLTPPQKGVHTTIVRTDGVNAAPLAVGPGAAPRLLLKTGLLPNYPNPFNPETWIPYQLAKPADVTLTIYALDGTVVRTLSLGHQSVGIYRSKSRAAYWDGKNAQGEPVASGVYFYTLTAGDFSATRKMLIRK
ncbi:hypothetical protein C6501_06055 [Candidatus Poribacteria bacterium]|nr:MAG: hypothetical protein C6501_06055 [Candidatus Poribacteria bacterium]